MESKYLINALVREIESPCAYKEEFRMVANKEDTINWIYEVITDNARYFMVWCIVTELGSGLIKYTYFNQEKTGCLPWIVDEFSME